MNPADAAVELAVEKANMGAGWRPYKFVSAHGAITITGCYTTVFKSGPRKGECKYLTKKGSKTVVVTAEEINAYLDQRAKGVTVAI